MKKNVYTTGILVFAYLITAVHSPIAKAQFDKYKSKTKFKATPPVLPPSGNANGFSDIKIPDTSKSATELLESNNKQDTTNFDSGGSESADDNEGDGPGGVDTFGRAPKMPTKPMKNDKKYVDLNPETAFGPEVVTSFDFPNVSILDLTKVNIR